MIHDLGTFQIGSQPQSVEPERFGAVELVLGNLLLGFSLGLGMILGLVIGITFLEVLL